MKRKYRENKVKSYVYALGKHLARVDGVIGDTNAAKFYYHTDHQGSVRAVTNQQGQVVWQGKFHAFGSRYDQQGEGEFDELHGFTGKEYDPDTGLYYYNARWYDPELGRFVTQDSYLGDPNDPGTLNRYTYCRNNPVNRIDPTGYLMDLMMMGESIVVETVMKVEA